jgi:hypothetical protein
MIRQPVRLERRAGQRFEVNLPLVVQFDGRAFPGFTRDVSGRGIFFYAEAALPEGAVVEVTFTMPSEITLAESMRVRCRGRVLRTSGAEAGRKKGIAVRLDAYQYLPSSPEEPAAECVRAVDNSPGRGKTRVCGRAERGFVYGETIFSVVGS